MYVKTYVCVVLDGQQVCVHHRPSHHVLWWPWSLDETRVSSEQSVRADAQNHNSHQRHIGRPSPILLDVLVVILWTITGLTSTLMLNVSVGLLRRGRDAHRSSTCLRVSCTLSHVFLLFVSLQCFCDARMASPPWLWLPHAAPRIFSSCHSSLSKLISRGSRPL